MFVSVVTRAKHFVWLLLPLGLCCLFGSINSTCAEAEALSACHKLEGSTERERVYKRVEAGRERGKERHFKVACACCVQH